jgi:hypothetical protein
LLESVISSVAKKNRGGSGPRFTALAAPISLGLGKRIFQFCIDTSVLALGTFSI